jgi:hypothetical protein
VAFGSRFDDAGTMTWYAREVRCGWGSWDLATAYQADGDLPDARSHWQEALDIYTDLGAPEADQVRARLNLPR